MSFVHFWKKTQKNSLEYRYKEPTQIIGKVDRIKKLSMEILEDYKEAQLEKESKMISEEESTQSQKIQTTSETSSDSPITENPEQELPKETSD